MKKVSIAAALAASVLLAGCNIGTLFTSGSLNAADQATVNSALNTWCPALAVVATKVPASNKTATAVIAELANICPPNAPPTTLVQVTIDVAAAVQALSPYLTASQLSAAKALIN